MTVYVVILTLLEAARVPEEAARSAASRPVCGLCHNTGVALFFLINVSKVLLSPPRWDTCHEWCGERKFQNRNPD